MLRPRRLRQITEPMTRGRCNVRPTTGVRDGHRGAAVVTETKHRPAQQPSAQRKRRRPW